MKYIDTETCGLIGPIVLIQWADDDGPVNLYSPWKNTILDTLKLIEEIVYSDCVCGFNLAYDWFHLCKMYTTLLLMSDHDAILEDCIEEYALNEPKARSGPCLKPNKAFDIMLYARKGPYQSTMNRDPIRVKRIPTTLAWEVAKELEQRIKLKDIYFGRRKDKKADRWKVMDIKDAEGNTNKDFKDVVLKFHPTSALKALAIDALGLDPNDTLIFDRVSLPKRMFPNDKKRGYAPYALAFGQPGNWNETWPDYIKIHSDHWAYNELARKYGAYDVVYLQKLYHHFGNPPVDDDDSVLACMVGAIRWRGFAIDIPALRDLKRKAEEQQKAAPTAPSKVKWYVSQLLDETEKLVIQGSTKKAILEDITKLLADCPDCKGNEKIDCKTCNNDRTVQHPAAARAKACLDARKAGKRIDVCNKLIQAGRFHASFVVLGTKSQRMSGADALNAQGIDHTKEMRKCFVFADPGQGCSIGDFKSFEPTLADAVYDDPNLRKDLMSGKSIHSLFGMSLFPDMSYEKIEASKGSSIYDYRDVGKRGFLAILYGGNENTLKTKLSIDLDVGRKAIEDFIRKKYKQIGLKQDQTRQKFCSMTQPKGLGTQVIWRDPVDFIEAKSGAKRYFTLENQICKQLFDLACSPPKHWQEHKVRVKRRDREQFAHGAVRSALYAAAFNLQSGNMRAAVNHEIQAYGAILTKRLQRRIWSLQPCGIKPWIVVPMNVHDEIIAPSTQEAVPLIKNVVQSFIKETRPEVPLLDIDWSDHMKTWADK